MNIISEKLSLSCVVILSTTVSCAADKGLMQQPEERNVICLRAETIYNP